MSYIGGGGGGGTPGGSSGQVQYNSSNTFGGSANFTWDNAASTLTVNGNLFVGTVSQFFAYQGGIVTRHAANANGPSFFSSALGMPTGTVVGWSNSSDPSPGNYDT